MKKCHFKGCTYQFSEIFVSIDNGETQFWVCPNHLVISNDELFETPLIEDKKESMRTDNTPCECCGRDKAIEYKDSEITFHLCEKHLHDFIDLNLTKKDFKTLYQKAGDVFMLHDDFYDADTGEALQPRR